MGQKKSRKISTKIPGKISSPNKKFTDELLQERRENVLCPILDSRLYGHRCCLLQNPECAKPPREQTRLQQVAPPTRTPKDRSQGLRRVLRRGSKKGPSRSHLLRQKYAFSSPLACALRSNQNIYQDQKKHINIKKYPKIPPVRVPP